MKQFEEMTRKEQTEVTNLFANWLRQYTHEVIVKVLEKRDEIISNEFAMHLLRELYIRDEKERACFTNNIAFLLINFDGHKELNPHSNPSTHAGSYRDILYDMYIRNEEAVI